MPLSRFSFVLFVYKGFKRVAVCLDKELSQVLKLPGVITGIRHHYQEH